MLAGFQQFGLQPGPLLFATAPQLVWGLIASLLIANVMLLVLNLPLIRLWVQLLTIPRPLALCRHPAVRDARHHRHEPVAGRAGDAADLRRHGFLMRLYGYPIAPVVVGLILGPMAEQQLRRALAISQGDWTHAGLHPTVRRHPCCWRRWPCSCRWFCACAAKAQSLHRSPRTRIDREGTARGMRTSRRLNKPAQSQVAQSWRHLARAAVRMVSPCSGWRRCFRHLTGCRWRDGWRRTSLAIASGGGGARYALIAGTAYGSFRHCCLANI